MSRWLTNFLRGRSLEEKATLTPTELEKLVLDNSTEEGNIEMEESGMTVISAKQKLHELYSYLQSNIPIGSIVLQAEHEAYGTMMGKQKHYLDIEIQSGNETQIAKITYNSKRKE